MPKAQSPAHYINSSKGCPSITESFPLCFLLELCATVAALTVVEPHLQSVVTDQMFILVGLDKSRSCFRMSSSVTRKGDFLRSSL
jgi:hypothetical protein